VARFSEYGDFDALGLAELIRTKQVSPEEVLGEAIARTQDINPRINAVVLPLFEYAYDQLRTRPPASQAPFAGVPFLLKDLHLMLEGTPTSNGSRLYKDYVADHNSTLAQRYVDAGFSIFGKTNSPEFGMTVTTEPQLYGPSRNPWNLDHSTGGSSGGAGAAVAAGLVPAAHASDGGGSIRIPAAACGLVGLKPTRARTPSGPDKGEGWAGCTCQHVVSRTVRDSAAILDATHGAEPGDPYAAPPVSESFLSACQSDPKPLRIAFSTKSPIDTPVDPDCVRAVQIAAQICADLGHEVEEAPSPLDGYALAVTLGNIVAANIAALFDAYTAAFGRDVQQGEVELVTWRTLQNGRKLGAKDYIHAVDTMHAAGRQSARFHQSYDVFIEPTLGKPPVPIGTIDTMADDTSAYTQALLEASPFTARYNLTGQPALSLPLHWTQTGLPVGVMFSAAFGDDVVLLQLATQIERAHPWADRRPAVA